MNCDLEYDAEQTPTLTEALTSTQPLQKSYMPDRWEEVYECASAVGLISWGVTFASLMLLWGLKEVGIAWIDVPRAVMFGLSLTIATVASVKAAALLLSMTHFEHAVRNRVMSDGWVIAVSIVWALVLVGLTYFSVLAIR